MDTLRIPAKDVAGCTCSSSGGDPFTADLLVERTQAGLSRAKAQGKTLVMALSLTGG